MVAGATARTTAATIVSPLEMIRTKMQSEQLNYRDIGKALRVTVAKNGISGFYLGWMPTLLRDIPFSGNYLLGFLSVLQAKHASVEENGTNNICNSVH
ncbi:unnamed protein product, partial [Strongylus vulgaris]